MSDDKAMQSKHSQQIAAERAIMQLTGLSRNQVRAGVRAFTQSGQEDRQAKPEPSLKELVAPRPWPELKITKIDMPPVVRRAPENEKLKAGGGQNVQAPATPYPEVRFRSNGTEYEGTFLLAGTPTAV